MSAAFSAGPSLGPPVQVDGPETFAAAFAVSRETLDKLVIYADLLRHWSRVQDLVAPGTMAAVWQRHFADSAQLLAIAPEARCWLDLGSGAGFPGMVIAIMLADHAETRVHLVESNSRKCAFLRDVAHRTGAPVDIHDRRIEQAPTQITLSNLQVVTARALAPLSRLLGLAAPFLSSQAVGVFPKGRDWARELEAARAEWSFEAAVSHSRTDPEGRIIAVRQLRRLERTGP